jgi:nicotinamidase-related amidase
MAKRAVVVVDLQNEYLASGNLPLHQVETAVENAAKVIEDARSQGDEVVHIRHEQPGAPFFVPGSVGAEIISSVAPQPGETVIVKNHPNSFRDTGLKQVLDEQGVDEVVIVGAMSHMCIGATARAATDQGYDTIIVQDACATMGLEFGGVKVPAEHVHAANMAALAFAHGRVVSTAELLVNRRNVTVPVTAPA